MKNTGFPDLTWEELRQWAGAKVVARGKSCRTAVEDLRQTTEGRLLAWVHGGSRYATVVSLSAAGKLSSVCSCRYHVACKHAVAMVLVYLDAVQTGKPVAVAADDDERVRQHADEYEEDDFTEVSQCNGATATKPATQQFLKSLSQAELLAFVQQLSVDFPDVRQRIADRIELQQGTARDSQSDSGTRLVQSLVAPAGDSRLLARSAAAGGAAAIRSRGGSGQPRRGTLVSRLPAGRDVRRRRRDWDGTGLLHGGGHARAGRRGQMWCGETPLAD